MALINNKMSCSENNFSNNYEDCVKCQEKCKYNSNLEQCIKKCLKGKQESRHTSTGYTKNGFYGGLRIGAVGGIKLGGGLSYGGFGGMKL